ncbi:hypothetical protein NLU13_6490 [Sarocladium strictum]|uniref:CCHC-type domain-containing protein n=1 Tax=Sarocladium strictum TaxID=5046 RepID=A0AA39GG03_SARSR|nr:hypothetical protein NLU13_6490 [Sarocladium strictum]
MNSTCLSSYCACGKCLTQALQARRPASLFLSRADGIAHLCRTEPPTPPKLFPHPLKKILFPLPFLFSSRFRNVENKKRSIPHLHHFSSSSLVGGSSWNLLFAVARPRLLELNPSSCASILESQRFAGISPASSYSPIEHIFKMSSLSRRACYKCGNVGHYAEVCSSAERLCYNCKQPGHESNGCPLPRTTEAKQCYHCQGLGHVQADCPTLRLSGTGTSGRCYNCGQPGHLARACPNPVGPMGRGAPMGRGGFAGGYGRGGFPGGPRPATCYKCGGPNHFARDCQAQAMKCYACGKLGHISRDCTAPNGGPLNTAGKTCYQCGEAGHISRDCPQKQAQGEINHEVDITQAPVAPVAPIAPVA